MLYYCLIINQLFSLPLFGLFFAYNIIVIVGLVVLLFFGKKWIMSDLWLSLFFCVLCYIFLSFILYFYWYWWLFFVCLLNLQYYYHQKYFSLPIHLLFCWFFILLYLWRDYWLFVARDVLELNSFVLLI